MKATLYTDGGARGNPGPAGIGYVLRIEDKAAILHGAYIGETTNNQAEYRALLEGMARALTEEVTALHCFLDSELVVKQMKGQYRVKHPDLKPVYEKAKGLVARFSSVAFTAIRREKNKEADQLVNEALDAQQFHR